MPGYIRLDAGSSDPTPSRLVLEGVGTFFLAISLFATSGLTSGRAFGGFDDDLVIGGLVVGGMLAVWTNLSDGSFHGNPAVSVASLVTQREMSLWPTFKPPSPTALQVVGKLTGAQVGAALLAHVFFNTVLGGTSPKLPIPGGSGQYHWLQHLGISAANEALLVLQLVVTCYSSADGASRGASYAIALATFGYRGQAVGNPALSLGIARGVHVPLVGAGGAGGATLSVIIVRIDAPLLAGLAGGHLSRHLKDDGTSPTPSAA